MAQRYAQKVALKRVRDQEKKASDDYDKAERIGKKFGFSSPKGRKARVAMYQADKAYKAAQKDYSKDFNLMIDYGQSAMKAKSFGTTYPKVKRNIGGLVKKRTKKSKVFSGTDYVKEVNNYKII